MIGLRIAAVVIGYFFGIFQTGYIYGKMHGVDIRKYGSGNTGATNTLRTMGWKAGAITFLGDAAKAILAICCVKFFLESYFTGDVRVLELYAGFGAVLGHNYPFYLKFKGGKGIACTAGVIFAICPAAVPVCLLVFILCLALSKYVSLGSILMAILLFVQIVLFNFYGILDIAPEYILEFNVVTFFLSAMAIWRHRSNLVRLANGTENRIGEKAEINETK